MALSLTAIDAAITEIQTSGQSFTLDGVTYSRANLSALITLRQQAVSESDRSDGTRPTIRKVNFAGMGY